jgi:hypothetical protein
MCLNSQRCLQDMQVSDTVSDVEIVIKEGAGNKQ